MLAESWMGWLHLTGVHEGQPKEAAGREHGAGVVGAFGKKRRLNRVPARLWHTPTSAVDAIFEALGLQGA